MSEPTSSILKGASVSLNGTMVTVDCEFEESVEDGVSCVVVFREYGNKTIVVEEYHQNTVFPVSLTVSDSLNYTFAVFGKNDSSFDHEPIRTKKIFQTSTATHPSPTITTTGTKYFV